MISYSLSLRFWTKELNQAEPLTNSLLLGLKWKSDLKIYFFLTIMQKSGENLGPIRCSSSQWYGLKNLSQPYLYFQNKKGEKSVKWRQIWYIRTVIAKLWKMKQLEINLFSLVNAWNSIMFIGKYLTALDTPS